MLEVTLDEAFYMAGVDRNDSEIERDLKFAAWVDQHRWRCVRTQEELDRARADSVEIIIKKGNVNV